MKNEDIVDGSRILEAATELAFPRSSGSEGDARAIALVEGWFRDAGLDTRLEWFRFDIRPAEWALRVLLIVSGLLVAAAGAFTAASPAVSLALLAAALLPGAALLAWAPWLERLYRREGRVRTANVIGHREAQEPRLTLILMAHHDSKSQSLTLPFRMGLTIVAIAGALALIVLVVTGTLVGSVPGPWWLPTMCGLATAGAAVLLSTMRNGNRSPGGVDNAGSVAIVRELALVLPELLPEEVELVFLSTGAEEDHMVGAMRWLDRHASDHDGRPTYCLNFDGAGAPGRVVLIERYGFGRLFSAAMSAAARRAAAKLGYRVRGILMLPAIGIDAIPFSHRGIPCLTLASGSLGKATMSVHSAKDRAEHLDPETLAAVTRLAIGLLLDLADSTPNAR